MAQPLHSAHEVDDSDEAFKALVEEARKDSTRHARTATIAEGVLNGVLPPGEFFDDDDLAEYRRSLQSR